MHAWLFRNRERLRLILGLTPPVREADLDSIPTTGRTVRRMVAHRRRRRRARPGQISRRGALVVLLPMPRRGA